MFVNTKLPYVVRLLCLLAWEGEPEDAATIKVWLYADFAVVCLYYLVADVQAQAEALVRASSVDGGLWQRCDTREWACDMGAGEEDCSLLRGDPRPLVDYLHANFVPVSPYIDSHRFLRGAELEGIAHQVCYHLLDACLIAMTGGVAGGRNFHPLETIWARLGPCRHYARNFSHI